MLFNLPLAAFVCQDVFEVGVVGGEAIIFIYAETILKLKNNLCITPGLGYN